MFLAVGLESAKLKTSLYGWLGGAVAFNVLIHATFLVRNPWANMLMFRWIKIQFCPAPNSFWSTCRRKEEPRWTQPRMHRYVSRGSNNFHFCYGLWLILCIFFFLLFFLIPKVLQMAQGDTVGAADRAVCLYGGHCGTNLARLRAAFWRQTMERFESGVDGYMVSPSLSGCDKKKMYVWMCICEVNNCDYH